MEFIYSSNHAIWIDSKIREFVAVIGADVLVVMAYIS
jgi:hypothetical protein